MRIMVPYASADGSTAGIAQRIAERLRDHGHEASAQPVGSAPRIEDVDAVVLGSAIHARQWLDDASAFVNAHRQALHHRPFWTFSVGMPDAWPRWFRKMARTEETGIIAELGDLQPCGHQLFSGVVKPSQFPLASRVFLRLAGGRYGDFRDWPAIDRWATAISDRLDALAVRPALSPPDHLSAGSDPTAEREQSI